LDQITTSSVGVESERFDLINFREFDMIENNTHFVASLNLHL